MAVLAALLCAPGWPAAAQVDLPPLPLPTLLPPLQELPLLSKPSPSPAETQQSQAPAQQAPQSGAPAPKASDGDYYPRCSKGVPQPPKLKRSPPGGTAALLRKAKPLLDIGLPVDRVMAVLAAPFPVAGQAKFSDDWKNPRWTPCPHLHMGNDIFAPKGTPIVASGPGTVSAFGNHPVGGLSVWVTYDDRHSFFYTHLAGFAPGLAQGQRVERSTVLGYVGATGNAAGGAPHLHFQVHPPILNRRGEVATPGGVNAAPGGLGNSRTPPVNPKPYLDQWLAQAERQADGLVAEIIRRGGILPTDAEAAEIIRSQSAALVSADGLFGLGPNANRGILAVTVALGVAALCYALTVVGRSRRMRVKPARGPNLAGMSLYNARRAVPPPAPEADPEPRRGRRRRE